MDLWQVHVVQQPFVALLMGALDSSRQLDSIHHMFLRATWPLFLLTALSVGGVLAPRAVDSTP